jgi:hypothetical protein
MFFIVVLLIRRKPMNKFVVALATVVSLGLAVDLTGLFWTRPYERMGLAKELGDAEEAV